MREVKIPEAYHEELRSRDHIPHTLRTLERLTGSSGFYSEMCLFSHPV